ncbi:MAG: bifunctional aspartate kinase/homoserine dehydrogenase I [Flavisolibacter sp.]
MQVLKFGGSSVADATNIKKVAEILQQEIKKDRSVTVLSALGGITDLLFKCGNLASVGDEEYKNILQEIVQRHLDTVKDLLPVSNQSSLLSQVMQRCNEIQDICSGIFLLKEFSNRTKDHLLSFGELISSQIVSAYLNSLSLKNTWKDSRQLIVTDSNFTKAAVDFPETNRKIREYFLSSTEQLFIVPGFIAKDQSGNTTTLGRGGSDYTAAIIGSAIDATVVQIWTDVPGLMTADPRLVSNAKGISAISYQEAMELSHFGAKVIYPPTIQPVMAKGIPVLVKNTFSPSDEGTNIQSEIHRNGNTIRGISSINHIALLSLEGSGMVGIPGFSKRLFEALAANEINVILITQASSEHSICVGVEVAYAEKAKKVIDKAFDFEIESGKVNPITVEKDLAIVALVGDNMKNHVGVSGKMFGVMGRNGVNIRAIAQGSSERNISAVIASADVKKAINVLHEEFFERTYKQVNLFIAGTGNVGGKLLDQIARQQEYLQNHLRLQIRVAGLANSRKMLFNDQGINIKEWKERLEYDGEKMDLEKYVQIITNSNLRNAVFVDITANESVAKCYENLFPKSISVVACNKIACSSPYSYYKKLKDQSRDYNASFLFETNVGASLPIIGTLNDLLRSGDAINRIEAVLSGTLNFVFNNYNGERTFAEVVRQAQDEGYTEPDPRLDLSGTDVMRKIMILIREAGIKIEMDEITNHPFMPPSCMTGSIDDFYNEMKRQEDHFKKLYNDAAQKGMKLKVVADYNNGKASVGLKHIAPDHDFFHLYGKDNIVLFYTDRYVNQPMVIKGAGAGAEVTASGVFADIIRTVSA